MSEDKTVEKLESIVDKKKEYFDEEELAVLRRVINMVRGLDTLGSLAGFVQKTVIWFGIVTGGIIAFKNEWFNPILDVIISWRQ